MNVTTDLSVQVPPQASSQELAIYEQTIKALGGQIDDPTTWIEFTNTGISVGDDGVLHVVACR